jgi:hypothetical protein
MTKDKESVQLLERTRVIAPLEIRLISTHTVVKKVALGVGSGCYGCQLSWFHNFSCRVELGLYLALASFAF